MKQQLYYPATISEQILWLGQFQQEYPAVAARLAVPPKAVTDTLHDLEWLLHGLRGLRAPLEHLGKAVTSFNKTLQTGTGPAPVTPPALIFPAAPESPPPKPGALRRVFKMVQVLKNARGYDESLGRQLGIEGNRFPEAESPHPTFSLSLIAGEARSIVECRFRRYGRPGVWAECQRGEEDWQPVASGAMAGIFCGTSFQDDRPLLQLGQPEYRHYRLRFWDGAPFGDWSPAARIMVGE